MKEQVISSRPARRGAPAAKGSQRPVRRDGKEPSRFSPRALLGYVPTAMKIAFGILAVIGLAIGYRAASSASLFQVRAVEVVGTSRTSTEEVDGLVRRAVSRTGVWRADLAALSTEVGRLPGVRRAVITRVLPDRLRVRITERVPLAVVRNAAGHFLWVDDEGVALGQMKSTDQMPPFFILGWNEEGTNEAREGNAERVKKYQEALREWQAVGVTERISEINLFDVRDVRAQLSGDDSQIEVRVGAQDLGSRLKTALEELDRYKQTPRGRSITYVDYQGDRVVLGFSSGGNIASDTITDAPADQTTSMTTESGKPAAVAANKKSDTKPATDSKKKPAVENKRKPNAREEKTAHANQSRAR
jgi:cell division protein FtsQ